MQVRDPWKGLRANSVLRSLAPQDAMLVGRSLHRVSLHPGDRLTPGETDLIYFPETLVFCSIGRGCNSAVGIIGRDGLVGWNLLFSSDGRASQVFVALTGGSALAISSARMRALMATRPGLAISLLPFLQHSAEQMGSMLLATLHGSIEARLCGWLLMMHERIEGDELRITHGALGAFLNVRRASVTDTLHVLEGERALRCTRGRVVVLDASALQNRAGIASTDRIGRTRLCGRLKEAAPDVFRTGAAEAHGGQAFVALT